MIEPTPIQPASSDNARVLMFSQRNIFPNALFRCPLYEFEDIICQLDSVDLIAPQVDALHRRHTLARRVAFHWPIAINPGVAPVTIHKKYDLFLAICGAPGDLLMVNAVKHWSDTCRTSICLLDELWVRQMSQYRHFLSILRRFDLVILYYSQTVEPLSDMLGCRCAFMPPGVDALVFSPYPNGPERVVDVYSIGRRGDRTHRALLDAAREKGLFYLHDTITGDQAIHSRQHRMLFANIAKKSRYFIVNPGLIDRPEIRGNQMEIGNRYFEGAAAGTIMIGECPDNQEFGKLFDWRDAVIHLPYDSGDVVQIIEKLDTQRERQDIIRRTNVTHALLRHDWAYRWETILRTVALEPLPRLFARKERLAALASTILNGSAATEPLNAAGCRT